MPLDESAFHALAGRTLDGLLDAIDGALGDDLDVELQGEVLTIDLPKGGGYGGGQYIVNKSAPLRQLWLSSPKSGAWHFDWDGGVWLSSRGGGETLDGLLSSELSALAGRPVPLPKAGA